MYGFLPFHVTHLLNDPYQAEDNCYRITFHKIVWIGICSCRSEIADSRLVNLHSRRSLPGVMHVLRRISEEIDLEAVYRRGRTNDPSGGWCRSGARRSGSDQTSHRDSTGQKHKFQ